NDWCNLTSILRGNAYSNRHARITNLRNPLSQKLRLQRCGMQTLQHRKIVRALADLRDDPVQVFVASPQTFSVDDTSSALLAHLNDKLLGGQSIRCVRNH